MTERTNEQEGLFYGPAAERAVRARSVQITIEGVGTIHLPPTEDLAFLAGVGLIAAAGIIEWPVAAILAAGHLITKASHNEALKQFGQALESA